LINKKLKKRGNIMENKLKYEKTEEVKLCSYMGSTYMLFPKSGVIQSARPEFEIQLLITPCIKEKCMSYKNGKCIRHEADLKTSGL